MLVDGEGEPVCGGIVAGEYLDETLGVLKRDKRLMPEDPHARAEIRRLIDWFLVKIETEVGRYLVRRARLQAADAQRGGRRRARSCARSAPRAPTSSMHLKYISWLAGSRNWLAGTRISQADLAAAAALVGARLSRRDRLVERTARRANGMHG